MIGKHYCLPASCCSFRFWKPITRPKTELLVSGTTMIENTNLLGILQNLERWDYFMSNQKCYTADSQQLFEYGSRPTNLL